VFRSIHARLYLLAALTLAPLVAVMVHLGFVVHRVRRDAVVAANLELARSVATTFRTYLDDLFHESGTLGRTLASGRLDPDEGARLLAASVGERPELRELSWALPDGTIAVSSNPASAGLGVGDQPYFRRVTTGEEQILSDLVEVRGGQPLVVVARAVRGADGLLLGVLLAEVAPERLGGRVLPPTREAGASVAIADRAGRLVFRAPDGDPAWHGRQLPGTRPPSGAAPGGAEATGALRAERGGGPTGAAVPVAPFGWEVRASRPRAETVGPVRREIAVAVGVAVAAALAALAISTLVGKRIAAGLRWLERHAEALRRGERPVASRARPPELERLTRSFDALAGRVTAARRRFEAVFQGSPTGIVLLDPVELRARWANRAFLGILDEPLQTEGIVGKAIDQFLPGAEELGLAAALRRAAATGEGHVDTECRYDRFARGVTWWRFSVLPVHTEEQGEEVLLAVTDVTEQVLARERVEAERRRLEVVLRTLPVGVFIADAAGQLIHANDEARRIWGGRAPLRGPAGFREYRARWAASGDPLEPGDWAIRRALRTGETTTGELIEIERFDGTQGTVLNNAAPIRDAEGRVVGAVAGLLDVTELRGAVARRDEILQVISHDLRTPLSSIALGGSALANLHDAPASLERARTIGRRIVAAGRQMNRLIDDLLDLAGLDEGRLSIRPAPCEPSELLGETVDQLRDLARGKGIELCLSAEPALPEVLCDRDRILQVLGNLTSNAVNATQEGAVCLAAEVRGGVVVIRVRDTGPGIPPEELPQIFDRSHRGAEARWRGMGLGLAISRGLIEAHGGAIWAESAPGEGTTVCFTLPRASLQEEPAAVSGMA